MAPAPSSPPAPSDDAPGPLAPLVTECLDRWDAEGPAALESLCREHPQHADALRRRIGRLREAGLIGDGALGSALPERLGGFRILSLLGRGGMGVVYLAEQEGLQRRVALKLVRPEMLWFPGSRERFRREIQAVARLAHPGIVPVYAGGEEQGLPFCAMEYVRGATLQEALDELAGREPARLAGGDLQAAVRAVAERHAPPGEAAPRGPSPGDAAQRLYAGTWTAACVRVARAVAEALQHAHGQGVLHRDVKPGNILLTPEGRVLLLDFGLAAAEGSVRLTATGGQLGSLDWMSPEQARGAREAVDARTDVYSLGVTLHEALALRPAFGGGSVQETLARILAGRCAPLRTANPAVPRDVETVCATAMEREPARRYADAAAFAADLAAVLELRPIAARRPGPLLRARRFAQRRPATAVALLLGALLALAGPLGWELSQARARRDLQAAWERSERHFDAALQAVGGVLRETASDDLADVPRMQLARLQAIDRALELFPALENDRPDDPLVATERAALHGSRGAVLRDLGRPEEALREFRAEVALRRALLGPTPDAARRAALGAALQAQAKTLTSLVRSAEALPLLEESVALRRASLRDAPDDEARVLDLCAALDALAEALRLSGDPQAALAPLQEALALVDGRPGPAGVDRAWTAGRVRDDLHDVLLALGRAAEARTLLGQALEQHRAAATAAPGVRFHVFELASTLASAARLEATADRADEAEALLAEAEALLAGLRRDFPDSERYARLQDDLLDLRALLASRAGDPGRVLALLEPLLVALEARTAAGGGRADLELELATVRANLANTLVLLQREPARAAALAGAAVAALRASDAAGRLSPANRPVLDFAGYVQAVSLCRLGDPAAARAAIEAYDAGRGASAAELRQAADLWNEWLLLRRAAPAADPARPADEALARARLLERLGQALDAGYADADELGHNPTLDALRGDADFEALLRRARSAAP